MSYLKLKLSKKCQPFIVVSFLLIMTVITAGSTTGIATEIHAQKLKHAQQAYAQNLGVYLTLYGINSTTGQVFAFVKAHNAIKSNLFNATTLDRMDNSTDGVGQTSFFFPNLTLSSGEAYTTCVVVVKDVKMICVTDYKTPYARPQFVDISIQ